MGRPGKDRTRASPRAKSLRDSAAARKQSRIELLYDIGTKLTRARDPENLIPDVLSTAASALSLRSAILAIRFDGFSRVMAWPGEGSDITAATEHAGAMFAYLLQAPELASRGVEVHRGALASELREPSGAGVPEGHRFLVLPLAVQGGPIFGALQLEPARRLDEIDLSFADTIISQLAIALDRHFAEERRLATSERHRTAAEAVATTARTGERRSRAERDFARSITRSLGEGVIAVGTDGAITLMNPTAERLLGWTEDEALGRNFDAVVSVRCSDGSPLPVDRRPAGQTVLSGREEHEDDNLFVSRSGVAFPVSYSSAPITENGQVVGAVVVFKNVSVLRAAEREQRMLADIGVALGASLDSSDVVAAVTRTLVPKFADVCFVDLVRKGGRVERCAVVFADPAKESLVDRVRAQAPQADWETGPSRVLKTGKPLLVADVDAVLLGAHDDEHRATLREVGVNSMIVAPLTAHGRVVGALGCGLADSGRRYRMTDLALASELAQRTALALDNARLYEDARAAVKAREDVLAVVSHDLRNPLGAIVMASEVLLRAQKGETGPERTERIVRGIRRSADGMNRLVERLLDFSRIQAGQLSLDVQERETAAIVAEAMAVMEPMAEEKGIALRTAIDPTARRVHCDVDRMLQVLGNLLGNALKFTPGGGSVTLRVEDAGQHVGFSVADTGTGIAAAQLAHVFDAFWQSKPGSRGGAGLGLAIAKGIVEAHHGRIEVESTVGEGTTFRVLLPRSGRPE